MPTASTVLADGGRQLISWQPGPSGLARACLDSNQVSVTMAAGRVGLSSPRVLLLLAARLESNGLVRSPNVSYGTANDAVGYYHGGMVKRTVIDEVRKACMALPEAEERPFGGHTAPSFRVRDKYFAMTSEDGQSLTLKVPTGVNAILVGDNPEQFFMPAYVASKGWVGVRLEVVRDWAEIDELIRESYRLIAPKRLGTQID